MSIDIFNENHLLDLIDEKGYVHSDIIISGKSIISLGRINKVYGDLYIYTHTLEDLGELNYIKGDFSIWMGNNLKSLCKLERIAGNCLLGKSNIQDLGNLNIVRGRLNLRDTPIKNLDNLKYVGKDLFLPKRLKGINLEHIEIKGKVRYFSDVKPKESVDKRPKLLDVGGENLRCNLNVDLITKEYSVFIHVWPNPKDTNSRYYKSEIQIREEEEIFQSYCKDISQDPNFLDSYCDSFEKSKLADRIKFKMLEELKRGIIDSQTFIEKSFYIIKVFSKSWFSSEGIIGFYYINDRYDLIEEMVRNYRHYYDFSLIHDIEYKVKKRILDGQLLINRYGTISELNNYIINNIDEYYTFINDKLDEIYKNGYSFFNGLFGKLMSIEEINNEFPKKIPKKLSRTELKKFILAKMKTRPLTDYLKVRKQYTDKKKPIMISYDLEHDLMFLRDDDYIHFNWFLESVIRDIFSSIINNSQNDFRVFKGVPKIGEGWVSETELFNLLKSEFKNEKVIHHGKPKWLGKQHVDIWFPKYKIGIEYQGKQHFEPVDFFGGEDGFISNIERDKRKRKLFKENGGYLIEVEEGYEIEKIVKRISRKIKKVSEEL